MDGLVRLCSVICPTGREKRAIDCITTTLLLVAFIASIRRYGLQVDEPHPIPLNTDGVRVSLVAPAKLEITSITPSTAGSALDLSSPIVVKDMLLSKTNFPKGKTSLTFRPGTLDMENADTFRYCYTDPQIYKRHFEGSMHFGAFSDSKKLIYFHVPKSGSSTARHVMGKAFDARETSAMSESLDTGQYKDYTKISFVRPPLDRFLSSYEEVFIRHAPWEKSRHIPKEFDVFGKGLTSYQEYQAVFCPPALKLDFTACTFGTTHENGTLLGGFEKFVRAYDGLNAFDVHLKLQAALLSDTDGTPLHIDILLNTSRSKEGWRAIGKSHGKPDMEPFFNPRSRLPTSV